MLYFIYLSFCLKIKGLIVTSSFSLLKYLSDETVCSGYVAWHLSDNIDFLLIQIFTDKNSIQVGPENIKIVL